MRTQLFLAKIMAAVYQPKDSDSVLIKSMSQQPFIPSEKVKQENVQDHPNWCKIGNSYKIVVILVIVILISMAIVCLKFLLIKDTSSNSKVEGPAHYGPAHYSTSETIRMSTTSTTTTTTTTTSPTTRTTKTTNNSNLNKTVNNSEFKTNVCLTDECVASAGHIFSSMDFSVNPCDDFYKFTCGNWKKEHPVPLKQLSWDHFSMLIAKISQKIKDDLNNMKNSVQFEKPYSFGKLYKFYHGCINQTSRSIRGYSSLKKVINQIGGWPALDKNWKHDEYDWHDALIKSSKLNHFPLFSFKVVTDPINTHKHIIQIGTADISGSDFFKLAGAPGNKEMLKIAKEFNRETDVTNLDLLLESLSIKDFLVELAGGISDISKNSLIFYLQNYKDYTFSIKELSKLIPGINFDRIFKSIFKSCNSDTIVFVRDIEFLKNLGQLIKYTHKRKLANYFATTFVMNFGKYTTIEMMDIFEEEYDISPIDQCFPQMEKFFPNLLGRLYADKHFDTQWMTDMTKIVDLIQNSFEESLEENQWMDDKTKGEAITKVKNINKNIAYPKWIVNDDDLDHYYNGVQVTVDDYLSSVISISSEKQKKSFQLLDDKSKLRPIETWPEQDASSVGAFYYFVTNGIYFPAGIAQYPFFIHDRPMVLNLGSIAMVIGHEITHSLDNYGRMFDSKGSYRNWWSDDTKRLFVDKSKCFVDQYNEYKYMKNNKTVNGTLTLSENIADNGGLRQAFRALTMYQKKRDQPFLPLPGKMKKFTEQQLFFISFANIWCSNDTPLSIEYKLLKDPHSPDSVRTNIPLANFDMFARAFNCKLGTRMNPKDKCVLW